jgi:hypothetical protein
MRHAKMIFPISSDDFDGEALLECCHCGQRYSIDVHTEENLVNIIRSDNTLVKRIMKIFGDEPATGLHAQCPNCKVIG